MEKTIKDWQDADMTRIIKCIHRNQLPNDYAFKNFNLVVPPGINCTKLCRGSTALGNSNMLFKVPQGARGNGSQNSKEQIELK